MPLGFGFWDLDLPLRGPSVAAAIDDVSCKSLEITTDYFPSARHIKNTCHPEAGEARQGTSHRLKR